MSKTVAKPTATSDFPDVEDEAITFEDFKGTEQTLSAIEDQDEEPEEEATQTGVKPDAKPTKVAPKEEDDLFLQDDKPEEEEVVQETKEPPAKKVDVKPEATEAEKELAKQLQEEVLKLVGKDAVAKVKGKDYKISELTPEEAVMFFRKGIRSDQIMRENADLRKTLENKEATLSQRLQLLEAQLLGRKTQESSLRSPFQKEVSVPKELEESELDDETTKGLKNYAKLLHKRIDTLEDVAKGQLAAQADQAFFGEINTHREDYPLASEDEVVAVKSVHPNIPVRDIMAESDKHYGSVDFVEKVFKCRPDIKRHFFEKSVQEYQAKVKNAPRIGLKATGSQREVKPAQRKTVPDAQYTFEHAKAEALEHLREVQRMKKEHDLS